MELQQMPGPTDEARALQLAQVKALDALYDIQNELAQQFSSKEWAALVAHPTHQAAQSKYDETVAQLEALLGPDAHCNFVDSELWSTFSDLYKSEAGFRPRWHMTRGQVKAYLSRPAVVETA